MKFVLATIFALAVGASASYYPPAIPAPVYGVPEVTLKEFKPVVPAPVYGVPEVTPIKTAYSYAVSAVPEEHHEIEVVAAPVAPATSSVHIEGPSTYTTVVGPTIEPHAYSLPHYPLTSLYGAGYSSLYRTGYSGYFPSLYSSFNPNWSSSRYSSLYPYAYSAPHVAYEPATPSVNIIGPKVSYVQPSVSAVVSGSQEIYDDGQYHEELYGERPVEAVISKVVEIPRPIVPHTTYGLPY